MTDFLNKIIGDLEGKKEWKALEARAKALPDDYRTAYKEIKHYVWQGGTGTMDPSDMFKQLVDIFEKGAANGKQVLDITGDDIAAFVDRLVIDEKTYADGLREKLNNTVTKKLKK